MKKIIIVGTGTNARHIFEFSKCYDLYDIVGFAVNEEYKDRDSFKELPVYSLEELDQKIDKEEVGLFIGMLWNRLNADRRKLFEDLSSQGFHFVNMISPNAMIRGKIEGTNVWVHDFAVIQNDTIICDNVSIMAMALIGANSYIGPHCFLGAKSTVGGGSRIGEQSFIGINCTVFDGTTIGKKCILGACTAVKRNVPDYSSYKTSSEITIKQYSEDEIENKLIASMNRR